MSVNHKDPCDTLYQIIYFTEWLLRIKRSKSCTFFSMADHFSEIFFVVALIQFKSDKWPTDRRKNLLSGSTQLEERTASKLASNETQENSQRADGRNAPNETTTEKEDERTKERKKECWAQRVSLAASASRSSRSGADQHSTMWLSFEAMTEQRPNA